jgi:phospholipid/cholesterol/gamma-HCH transport system substrate-binding protein
MAPAKKTGWAQLRVGLMAIVALIILGVLIFLLTGTQKLFADHVTIYTYMADSAALTVKAPVRINGILAGKISKVALSGETAPRRIIRIDMEIEKGFMQQIPVDSIAAISSENVLGAKFINIRKGQSNVTVQPGGEVQSLDTRDFDEIFQQGYALLTQLQLILKRVDAIVSLVEVGKGSIGKLLVDEELYDRIIAMVSEGQKITKAMTTPQGTIGKLLYEDTVLNDFRASMAKVDSLLLGLQQGQGSAGKILKDEALYNELRGSVVELRQMVADLNAGKGTAGKLLKSEELHNQIRGSLAKMDTIIDRINSGQGTIGQLMVNPQLYDTLTGATGEMQQLIKDIRANPTKFLRIKLALF